MADQNKIITKHIPKEFKEKFAQIKETHIKKIEQKDIEKTKGNLSLVMNLKSPGEMKFVGLKMFFLTKDGVLCEAGSFSEGFNEDEWRN